MERRKAGIFSICVFNNLVKICLIFFRFFFMTVATTESAKYLNFNDIDFRKFFAILC